MYTSLSTFSPVLMKLVINASLSPSPALVLSVSYSIPNSLPWYFSKTHSLLAFLMIFDDALLQMLRW